MFNVRLAGDHLYRKWLFTWLAGDIFDGVLFCAVLFPARCLGWNLGLNWVSSWEFSYLLIPMGCFCGHISVASLYKNANNILWTEADRWMTYEVFMSFHIEPMARWLWNDMCIGAFFYGTGGKNSNLSGIRIRAASLSDKRLTTELPGPLKRDEKLCFIQFLEYVSDWLIIFPNKHAVWQCLSFMPKIVLKVIREVSQKVVPFYNGFMALLYNYLCDKGYFLWWNIIFTEFSCCITGLWHPINRNYVFKHN